MKQYKRPYTYQWKNRRKTWEFANMPVYLDFEDCIFKVLDDYRLIKIKTEDFINKIKTS